MALDSYAFILFDSHGETSIVNTKKFNQAKAVKKALRQQILLGKQQYLVEVLEISDNNASLKKAESIWLKSHRAQAIEKVMDSRAHSSSNAMEGGYLDVWPSLDIDEENQPQPKRRKKTVPSTRNPAPVKPVKPVLPTRSKPTTVQSKPTTSKSASTKLPSTIEGSNGRKLTVLHEGSGDYGNNRAIPRRKPVHLDGLTQDQRDLVQLQIHNHQKRLVSVGPRQPVLLFCPMKTRS